MPQHKTVPRHNLSRFFAIFAVVFVFSALTTPIHAAGIGLQITKSWARATTPSAKTGAAYVTLANMGNAAERLINATSPAAKKVEVHTHVSKDGMMSMRKLDEVDIPANDIVIMKPGGMHLMLMGLTAPLIEGQSVSVVLHFESGLQRTAEAKIFKAGSRGPQHKHGDKEGHTKTDHERHMSDPTHEHDKNHQQHDGDHSAPRN